MMQNQISLYDELDYEHSIKWEGIKPSIEYLKVKYNMWVLNMKDLISKQNQVKEHLVKYGFTDEELITLVEDSTYSKKLEGEQDETKDQASEYIG